MKTYQLHRSCIDACLQCAALCQACAIACTKEENIKMMARCIQLDMECAAICYSAAQLMSLGSSKIQEICRLCATICEQCGHECSHHDSGHCRACAEQCLLCADECRSMSGIAS